jgi:hypothetical protein
MLFMMIQDQQDQVKEIQTRLPTLSDALACVARAEQGCVVANVEENDYTVFTCQDLEFELGLVTQSVAKKISFIDNQVRISLSASYVTNTVQIVSRNMTNLTPAQLEQFESAFRYFDREETNTLSLTEMSAALASQGVIYSVSASRTC